VINVVNRHHDLAIEAEILAQTGKFVKSGTAFEVNGPDVKSLNGSEKENVGTVEKKFVTEGADRFIYRFPAHSFTLIEIGLEERGH
jgi:alpha-L-arabinofuranosidase